MRSQRASCRVCAGCRGVSVRSRRMAMRRALMRVACGTVVMRVAAWGAVCARGCDALAACALSHLRRDGAPCHAPHGGDLAIHACICATVPRWPQSSARTNGPGARVCGSALCGGSAWPAGFAHAARGKSAGPPALHGLQLRGNCSP